MKTTKLSIEKFKVCKLDNLRVIRGGNDPENPGQTDDTFLLLEEEDDDDDFI